MAVTPFIKPIPNSRGILYTMQSALNDMTTAFSHDNKRFRMSKFALLNLPSFEVPNVDGSNATQINSTGDEGENLAIQILDALRQILNARLKTRNARYNLQLSLTRITRTEQRSQTLLHDNGAIAAAAISAAVAAATCGKP